jgi:hypothetical protein
MFPRSLDRGLIEGCSPGGDRPGGGRRFLDHMIEASLKDLQHFGPWTSDVTGEELGSRDLDVAGFCACDGFWAENILLNRLATERL